eukprot:scaffold421210_cov50-Attheya_sp.AAC.5
MDSSNISLPNVAYFLDSSKALTEASSRSTMPKSPEKGGNIILSIKEDILQLFAHTIDMQQDDLAGKTAGHEREQQIHDKLNNAGDGSRNEHIQSIGITFDQSLEQVNHVGWIRRGWAGGIRNHDKISDALGHGANASVGLKHELVDFSTDVGVPGLAIGAKPENGTPVLGQTVPVLRG